MSSSNGFLVASEERVFDALDDLARRVHAVLGDDVRIVGILRRGAPVAEEIGRRLEVLSGQKIEIGTLRLKRYTDDLTIVHEEPELGESEIPFETDGARILLVDDVIYTGRTVLRALTHLNAAGARTIHLGALCARGKREIPVCADFVAMRLDVGEGNVVEVHAPPFEERWEVRLFHREDLEE